MKKTLLLALLSVSLDIVSGQILQSNFKTKSKHSSHIVSIKANHLIITNADSIKPPFLTAYAPKSPQFEFGFQSQKKSNSDSGSKRILCGCGNWSAANSPLFFVFSRKKRFKVSSINNIKPPWIKSISILKDSIAVVTYGEQGKNGIILLTINDTAFPAVYRQLKRQNKTSFNVSNL
ncbi:MAG: hypothetical protein ACRYGB_12400 [Janthinobacterium lividum]